MSQKVPLFEIRNKFDMRSWVITLPGSVSTEQQLPLLWILLAQFCVLFLSRAEASDEDNGSDPSAAHLHAEYGPFVGQDPAW